ncbi:MAG: HAD hydrolase-like protein, partial [Thermotogaceae bacterium]|nr:HAD hydrolase-like protein [Thermotogaceae bacterium]
IEMLLNRYGFTKDQVAIVGDRLYTDIKLGKNSNILTILVLTGETTLEDLKNSDVRPDLVVRDLGEVAKML